MLSIYTLKKLAIIGASVSGFGSAYFYYGIQKKISSGGYYKLVNETVEHNEQVSISIVIYVCVMQLHLSH